MNQLNIFATLDELEIEYSVTETIVVEPPTKTGKPDKTYIKLTKETGPQGMPKTMTKDGITYEYQDMTRVCDAMFIGVNIANARGVAEQYERLTWDVETANKLRAVCDEMKAKLKEAAK